MSSEMIAHAVRGLVVRDALENAVSNRSDIRSWDTEAIAVDMLDGCQPVEEMFWEESRGPLWHELLEHIRAWKGGVQ